MSIEIDFIVKNREQQKYREEIESILAQCQKSIDEAYHQYEVEIEHTFKEFRENITKPKTWVH